jgi:hypothetical protein
MTALALLPELTVSRHNPLVDPHLHIWEWQIPVYLFFGGLVAGLMIIAPATTRGIGLLHDRAAHRTRVPERGNVHPVP